MLWKYVASDRKSASEVKSTSNMRMVTSVTRPGLLAWLRSVHNHKAGPSGDTIREISFIGSILIAATLAQSFFARPSALLDAGPTGDHWLHEIKYDGYPMHATLDHGVVNLLTRTELD